MAWGILNWGERRRAMYVFCLNRRVRLVMQFEKNTFVFFKKNCFLWRKKHDLWKKHWKSVFFCFFYNKLCIKEKRKVVLLIWGPGDPVCPREVKITPPTPHAAHSVALCVGTGPTGGYFVSWLLRPSSFYVSMTFAVNKRHLSFVKFNDYNKNPLDNHIAILHCWYCYRVKIIIPVPVAT